MRLSSTFDLSESLQFAYDFYLQYPNETLILVTADHETGGCILGNGTMDVNTERLRYQKMSGIEMSLYIEHLIESKPDIAWIEVKPVLAELAGLEEKFC